MSKAAVLLSGGLDSAVVLALAAASNDRVLPVFFSYGQRSATFERAAAEKLAALYETEPLKVINLEGIFGASSLVDSSANMEKGDGIRALQNTNVSSTYVPARNLVFLSIAAAYAASQGAVFLYAGLIPDEGALEEGEDGWRGSPDTTQTFADVMRVAFQESLPFSMGVDLVTPLIAIGKLGAVKLGTSLGVPFDLTLSCFDPDEAGGACGECEACLLRKRVFSLSGIPDPTRYGTKP